MTCEGGRWMKLAQGRVEWWVLLLAMFNLSSQNTKEVSQQAAFSCSLSEMIGTTDTWMQNNLSRQYDVFE